MFSPWENSHPVKKSYDDREAGYLLWDHGRAIILDVSELLHITK